MSLCQSNAVRRPHTATAAESHDAGNISPWSAWCDEDLLVEYAGRKTREAFEELVHRYERPLYSYLCRYLRSAELAEDVFQTTFLQVHVSCSAFDPTRRFRPWLYRIATTRAIDLMRRNRRHRLASLNVDQGDEGSSEGLTVQNLLGCQDANPGEQMEAAEDGQRVRAAVELFPTRLKDVVLLVMFQGLKPAPVADGENPAPRRGAPHGGRP
jgi:RNA polymerase sigma-70 factor (ECF subfamily)